MDAQMIDSLCSKLSPVSSEVSQSGHFWNFNGWTLLAVAELLAVIVLVFLTQKKEIPSGSRAAKKKIISADVDFGNIVNSAFHAERLYNSMKAKVHPDKFATDEKKCAAALDIFQQMTKYRTDMKKLEELKRRAIDELDVKF